MKAAHNGARLIAGAAFCLALLSLEGAAQASPPDLIEAGASQNHIFIEPSYDGTSIALFGSVDSERLKGQPFDVAVTLHGPLKPVTVWKKEPRAGLWINAQRLTFNGVPNYYAALSTKPLPDIASLAERKTREIGIDALKLAMTPEEETTVSPAALDQFRDALIKLKRSAGLFVEENQTGIVFFGARLFRARVFLPPAAGPGLYRANFYVLQNGAVIGEASAHIRLNKIGIEAALSSAAADHPWLYGVLSVLIAAAVGGGASLVFRRT
jgi:uncharacterized protein (TIGR02186 family)